MHRFFHPHLASAIRTAASSDSPVLSDAIIELDKDESHHAAKVLRLLGGEPVGLLDGQGCVAQGTIERIGSRVTVRVTAIRTEKPPVPVIDVATAIPKGPRADAMIEQLSQLGCDELLPLRTRRSVVDPRETKLDRFARVAAESAKQCGRAYVMRMGSMHDFGSALWKLPHDLRLLTSPLAGNEDGRGSNQVLESRIRIAKRILILIGPEGGWAEEELRQAMDAGCLAWSLGSHIMRIETAATAAVALARYMAANHG